MSGFTSNELMFKFGSATDIGGGRENQDECFVWQDTSHHAIALCVLDGHGREVGKVAASAAKAALIEHFDLSREKIMVDPTGVLIEAHNVAHGSIKRSFAAVLENLGNQICESNEGYLMKRKNSYESWMCVHGGTSCTIVLIVGFMTYVANVGDSNAVVYSLHESFSGQDLVHIVDAAENGSAKETSYASLGCSEGKMSNMLIITAEHSPESAFEFNRLRKFRPHESDPNLPAIQVIYDVCSHDKSKCIPVFNPLINPLKPSGKGNYYKNVRREWASLVATPPSARFQDALAFTRSLGDLHLHTYGVTHLPEVHGLNLDSIFRRITNDCSTRKVLCIVVASDGVWDNWQYEDVGKFVLDESCLNASFNLSDGTQKVADSFISRNALLSKRNFGNQADNATCIVLYVSIE